MKRPFVFKYSVNVLVLKVLLEINNLLGPWSINEIMKNTNTVDTSSY